MMKDDQGGTSPCFFGLFLHVKGGWGIGFSTEQNRFSPCPQDLSVQPILLVSLLVRSFLFRILHFRIENTGEKDKKMENWTDEKKVKALSPTRTMKV